MSLLQDWNHWIQVTFQQQHQRSLEVQTQISKLMQKKRAEKLQVWFSFNLAIQMCALIPTSTLETDMQASLFIHSAWLPRFCVVFYEVWVHMRCVYTLLLQAYSSFLIPPQVTMCIHSTLLQMFSRSVCTLPICLSGSFFTNCNLA